MHVGGLGSVYFSSQCDLRFANGNEKRKLPSSLASVHRSYEQLHRGMVGSYFPKGQNVLNFLLAISISFCFTLKRGIFPIESQSPLEGYNCNLPRLANDKKLLCLLECARRVAGGKCSGRWHPQNRSTNRKPICGNILSLFVRSIYECYTHLSTIKYSPCRLLLYSQSSPPTDT